jgi:hypothetical protein
MVTYSYSTWHLIHLMCAVKTDRHLLHKKQKVTRPNKCIYWLLPASKFLLTRARTDAISDFKFWLQAFRFKKTSFKFFLSGSIQTKPILSAWKYWFRPNEISFRATKNIPAKIRTQDIFSLVAVQFPTYKKYIQRKEVFVVVPFVRVIFSSKQALTLAPFFCLG